MVTSLCKRKREKENIPIFLPLVCGKGEKLMRKRMVIEVEQVGMRQK